MSNQELQDKTDKTNLKLSMKHAQFGSIKKPIVDKQYTQFDNVPKFELTASKPIIKPKYIEDNTTNKLKLTTICFKPCIKP